MAIKQCAWKGCESVAAIATRTKPAWCDEHITKILREGGLQPLEPFTKPTARRMTRCLTCGCEAHYRLAYTLDLKPFGQLTCRACYWAEWTAESLRLGGHPEEAESVSENAARAHADAYDYDYLGPAPLPPAQRVRCPYCGRVSAERMGDISWGCNCQVNPTRAAMTESVHMPEQDEDGQMMSGLNPELVEQWHPTKNLPTILAKVNPRSRRVAHWREPSCGHEWAATPAEREKRQRLRCPECRTIVDSLWHFPDLAAEWSPANPLTAWHVRPSGATRFVPEWVCAKSPGHQWRVATQVRVNGSTCPECRETGKSMVELRYFEAIREAPSGLAIRSPAFSRRTVWTPDVTLTLDVGRTLLVEYDGAYWHAEKAEVDRDKSRDLLAAAALVVRLRESPLPPLGLESGAYLEVPVSSTSPDPPGAVGTIRAWLPTVAGSSS